MAFRVRCTWIYCSDREPTPEELRQDAVPPTRFCGAARELADARRTVPARMNRSEVLCLSQARTVGQDWCVRYENRWPQLAGGHEAPGLAGKQVKVLELRDDRLVPKHGEQRLSWTELPAHPTAARVKKPIVNNKAFKPTGKQSPPAFRKVG